MVCNLIVFSGDIFPPWKVLHIPLTAIINFSKSMTVWRFYIESTTQGNDSW